MIDFLLLLGFALTGLFRSRARLEAEILVLRQQINVLRRKSPKRPVFSNIDRLLLVWLSRLVPTTLEALTVVRPETVIRWHRAGYGHTRPSDGTAITMAERAFGEAHRLDPAGVP
jgi:hypothetical protein